jgi:hypothetical protein
VTRHRTAGQPDPGHRNGMGGHPCWTHRRPTPWRGCWQGRPRRRRPTSRSRLDAPAGKRRLGEQPPGPLSSKDSEGIHAARDGPGHRRDRQLQVVCRRPAGASAHCSPSERIGSSVERTATLHPLWQALCRERAASVRLPGQQHCLCAWSAGKRIGRRALLAATALGAIALSCLTRHSVGRAVVPASYQRAGGLPQCVGRIDRRADDKPWCGRVVTESRVSG